MKGNPLTNGSDNDARLLYQEAGICYECGKIECTCPDIVAQANATLNLEYCLTMAERKPLNTYWQKRLASAIAFEYEAYHPELDVEFLYRRFGLAV